MTGPVAIVATGELFGGAERHIHGLGIFLRDRDLSPQIILFHDRELSRQCREDGLPVHVIEVRSAYDPAGPRQLGALLDELDVQVVHVHGYKAAGNAALAPGRRPMVSTLHGQGEPTWRHGMSFLKDTTYRTVETWSCRRRRAVVCFVTDDLKRRHAGRYGALDCRTVHNGIEPLDAADQGQRPDEFDTDHLHALMVGRLSGVKAIDVMIDALAQLPTDHRWRLHLVGDGGLRHQLEAQATRLGVADQVVFHGFRRDVFTLMAHSDLLVMSSHHEGLPYTLLEAMSLGLPALCSDVGGLAEVLEHERTGWLVPPGDPAGFARALETLGNDANLRHRLGVAAAVAQRQHYTLQSMGEKYLAAYEAAIAGRR